MLGIAQETVDSLLKRPIEPGDLATENLEGKFVCFTGELRCFLDGERITRDLAKGIVEDAGLHVAPRVTKKLDVLVVADPDTASGKAKKARDYGVRIIAERSFWQKLGVAVD